MDSLLFTPEQSAHAAALTEAFIERYHASLESRPVFPDIDRPAMRALMQTKLPDESTSIDALFEELDAVIVPNSTHTAHPRFLSYVMPSPNGLSPYAEAAGAALNQNCNLWTLSPAAAAIEQTVVRWFCDLFGFGADAGGGALTITVVAGSNRTRIVGCMTDAAISDAGTGTVTSANTVY